MIRSMTAFASRSLHHDLGEFTWELRSVNHRYFESTWRLPEELRGIEPELRDRAAGRLSRGKLDASLRWRAQAESLAKIDLQRLDQLADAAQAVHARLPDLSPGTLADWLQLPGILAAGSIDRDQITATALDLFDEALADLTAGREREGGRIEAVLRPRLDAIQAQVEDLRARMPAIRDAVAERWRGRLADLTSSGEPGRLEQEITLALSKLDVDEELDRLAMHVREFAAALQRKEPVGRRLDFLTQEFHREANTLGSKAADTDTSRAAVELKVLVEQIREQVQNVE